MQKVRVPATTWTERQKQMAKLLFAGAFAVMGYGGSQSGKTRLFTEFCVRMCYLVPGLIVLITRQERTNAKATIWHQSLLNQVLPKYAGFEINKSDLLIEFENSSEINVMGAGDETRIDKVLGRGVGLAYLNESSENTFRFFNHVSTRLSQKIEYGPMSPRAGQPFNPMIITDCNPPGPKHWIHRVFIDHMNPGTDKPLDPAMYLSMMMNPIDNQENLPDGYIRRLEDLPPNERDRFLYGKFVKPTGAIFPEYSQASRIAYDRIPECEQYWVGVDLITYAAVLVGTQRYSYDGEIRHKIYCIDEWTQRAALAHDAEEAIEAKWGSDFQFNKIIDHNLGKAGTREFARSVLADKGQGSVDAGIVLLQTAMHHGDFLVSDRCHVLNYELENYHRDEKGAIVKADDHHIDAVRMVVYTKIRRKREIKVYI